LIAVLAYCEFILLQIPDVSGPMIAKSINSKIMVGYAAVMIVTATVGLATYLKSSEVSRQNESFAKITLPTISAA